MCPFTLLLFVESLIIYHYCADNPETSFCSARTEGMETGDIFRRRVCTASSGIFFSLSASTSTSTTTLLSCLVRTYFSARAAKKEERPSRRLARHSCLRGLPGSLEQVLQLRIIHEFPFRDACQKLQQQSPVQPGFRLQERALMSGNGCGNFLPQVGAEILFPLFLPGQQA